MHLKVNGVNLTGQNVADVGSNNDRLEPAVGTTLVFTLLILYGRITRFSMSPFKYL